MAWCGPRPWAGQPRGHCRTSVYPGATGTPGRSLAGRRLQQVHLPRRSPCYRVGAPFGHPVLMQLSVSEKEKPPVSLYIQAGEMQTRRAKFLCRRRSVGLGCPLPAPWDVVPILTHSQRTPRQLHTYQGGRGTSLQSLLGASRVLCYSPSFL